MMISTLAIPAAVTKTNPNDECLKGQSGEVSRLPNSANKTLIALRFKLCHKKKFKEITLISWREFSGPGLWKKRMLR
jgi:hypothetical protein